MHLSAWILQSSLRSGPPDTAHKDLMGYPKGAMRTAASDPNPDGLIWVQGQNFRGQGRRKKRGIQLAKSLCQSVQSHEQLERLAELAPFSLYL